MSPLFPEDVKYLGGNFLDTCGLDLLTPGPGATPEVSTCDWNISNQAQCINLEYN